MIMIIVIVTFLSRSITFVTYLRLRIRPPVNSRVYLSEQNIPIKKWGNLNPRVLHVNKILRPENMKNARVLHRLQSIALERAEKREYSREWLPCSRKEVSSSES